MRGRSPEKRAEIGLALVGARDVDAIEQHQRVVAFRATDADLRERARRAGLVDGNARNLAQRVRHIGVALILDHFAADHGQRRADLLLLDGRGRAGDHNNVARVRQMSLRRGPRRWSEGKRPGASAVGRAHDVRAKIVAYVSLTSPK